MSCYIWHPGMCVYMRMCWCGSLTCTIRANEFFVPIFMFSRSQTLYLGITGLNRDSEFVPVFFGGPASSHLPVNGWGQTGFVLCLGSFVLPPLSRQIFSRSGFFWWCFVDHFLLMGIIGKPILAAYRWRQHPPLDGLPVHFVGLVPCTMVPWHWTKNLLLSILVPNGLSYRRPDIV